MGFDVGAAISGRAAGALGMGERIEMLGGHFAIESKPGWEHRICPGAVWELIRFPLC